MIQGEGQALPKHTAGRVLIVAGSDSGGGAGIQGDLKTVTLLGAYGMTAITALTVQNTLGVQAVQPVPVAVIQQQMQACLQDIGADAIKTGMLHSAEVIAAVVDVLRQDAAGVPLVVDPVMVAKGGHALLQPDAESALLRELMPLATVVTPNIPEAERLTGCHIADEAGMLRAGRRLCEKGARAVLMKGGHLPGDRLVDVLMTADGVVGRWEGVRRVTAHTHGTGCSYASAIAAGLAQELPLEDAVARAYMLVQRLIAHAPGLGQGKGPLGHHLLMQPT